MTSTPVSDDSIFLHESVIRGHHIFKGTWTPRTEVIVQVRQEAGNPHDRKAVALLKADGTLVGRVPSSFLLGSLGQQSLLTLHAWAIAMILLETFDLKRMRLINQALIVTVIKYALM